MKRSVNFTSQKFLRIFFILFALMIASTNGVDAQDKQSVKGKLIEGKSNKAVPFATIALIRAADSTVIGGAMSDESGVFIISPVIFGIYVLRVSNIGYKPVTKKIEVINKGVTDAGFILLQDTAIILDELVIVGEKIKAKSESDRTTYFITKKMLDVSNTGADVLKYIPGVQIDLMQNISLEGSRDILIYVDGKERDKSFMSQLDPKQIDKIEVISLPPSNYDGNLTGAINIILKKDRDSGINGQILAEIPTSASEIYIFPGYSLNYGYRKLNLYTSYNGELTYLNLHESTSRKVLNDREAFGITSNQYVRQKNWSHRFHLGFDYYLSDKDQFNFYAFYNPYSRELDGNSDSEISGTINDYWQAKKEDTDVNTSAFYSFYYKHGFNKKGSEITADISNYRSRAENRTDYIYTQSDNSLVTQTNIAKPEQNVLSMKTDYTALLSDKVILSTGAKAKLQLLQDQYNNFEYNENIFAAYGNIAYNQTKYNLSLGLRTEKSISVLKENFSNPVLVFLPYANFRYKLNSKQNIQLSYDRSIKRPNIYQLNPFTAMSDPYTVHSGNPFLKPELIGSIFLEHSIQFKGNYFASRLFYDRATDVIDNLTFITDTSVFETQVQNLGTVNKYGLQFSGALKFSILTINPYIKFYGFSTSCNNLAGVYSVRNKNSLALESGLSAIASFKHDLAFSLTFQYNSPKSNFQGNSFSGLLYFISLEKTIKQRFKLGIVSAMPFTKLFTYNGSEINGPDFHSYYKGNVILSRIPFWFKLSYQFSSGKNRASINRVREEIDNLPDKGF